MLRHSCRGICLSAWRFGQKVRPPADQYTRGRTWEGRMLGSFVAADSKTHDGRSNRPGLACAPVMALSSKHVVHNWTMLVQIQSGVLCSHSSIGSERHSATVKVDRSNRSGSTDRYGGCSSMGRASRCGREGCRIVAGQPPLIVDQSNM